MSFWKKKTRTSIRCSECDHYIQAHVMGMNLCHGCNRYGGPCSGARLVIGSDRLRPVVTLLREEEV